MKKLWPLGLFLVISGIVFAQAIIRGTDSSGNPHPIQTDSSGNLITSGSSGSKVQFTVTPQVQVYMAVTPQVQALVTDGTNTAGVTTTAPSAAAPGLIARIFNYFAGSTTVVASGSNGQVQAASDTSGRQIYIPYAPLASWHTASGAVSTATSVQIIAKSGALNNTILGFTATSTSTTVANESCIFYLVTAGPATLWTGAIQDVTASTTGWIPMAKCDYPLPAGNNPVTLTTSAAVTQIQWSTTYVQDN